jgi:uncharacterized protein (DUF2236 family)
VPERTHAERMAGRDGYFPPESLIRRLGNSPVVPFLGGGPAVLLQVAHPLVAAGVTQHSDYRDDLWRRLLRTLRALYLMTYGTKQEAEWAGEAVQRVHESVHGTLAETAGQFPAGTPYRADDPALMLWVHATLVHSSLAAFTRFVARLDAADEERYYREMAVVARLFGVPDGVLPDTLGEFRAYVEEMLAGPELVVTPPARDVARVVLDAPLPAPMRVLMPAHRLSTAWLLGQRLRSGYGLRWSPVHDATLAVAARSVRITAWPVLKAAARFAPTGPPLARA